MPVNGMAEAGRCKTMTDESAQQERSAAQSGRRSRLDWRRNALGLGAAAALLSATLAVLANLSEVAGWFRDDETQALVEQTRVAIEDTDAKVNELLNLLRNQAAAAGVDLNIESEVAIRNAIQTIIASANAQKQTALAHLDDGNVSKAADMLTNIAASQALAVAETGDAAAATWREAGALYFMHDIKQAVRSYEEADRLQPGNPETLDMLGHSLIRAGRLEEARNTFEECLAQKPSPAVVTSARNGLGNIAKQTGEYALARSHFSQALETSRANKLVAEQTQSLVSLATIARVEGEPDLAERQLQQAESLASEIDNGSLKAKIQTNLGIIAAARGEYDEAEKRIREALEIHRAGSNLAGQANAIGNLGAVALKRGDFEDAETLLLESVDIGERLGWKESVAYDLVNLGGMALARSEFETADEYLGRAEVVARDAELGELLPVIVFNRGEIALERGDVAAACGYWSEAGPALSAMGSSHAETATRRIDEAACTVTAN
jgi:tetratricopeptide (TPR) repeat protein